MDDPIAPVGIQGGMVAGTSRPVAIQAGVDVLQNGGTAADAAVTTSLAQIALVAGCWISYAGRATLIYFDASTKKVHFMNAGFNTVRNETDPFSIPRPPDPSGRSALVPGFMAGMEAMNERFGKKSFADLFEPAIQIAEEGFVIDAHLGGLMDWRQDVLTRLPESREVFTKPDGTLYTTGDLFKQPALAGTLRKIAEQGATYMYDGDWGQKFVETVRREGGKMTQTDLSDYEVEWGDALRTGYKNFDIYAPGFPHFGGTNALQTFNLLELANVSRFGDYTESADGLFWFMKVINPFWDDTPGFTDLGITIENRWTKGIANRIWGRLTSGATGQNTEDGSHSAGVVAVDSDGNVAALLHTINTNTWGWTGINIDGITVPDAATHQQFLVNIAGPGNKLPHQGAPLIVMQNGAPVIASSATGVGLHHTSVQALLNIMDYGMTPQEAEDVPHFWATQGSPEMIVKAGDFDPAVLQEVQARGQPIRIQSDYTGAMLGFWTGITIDPMTGKLEGGASRVFDGTAIGY